MTDEKLRNYVIKQRRLLELELHSDQEETTNAASMKTSKGEGIDDAAPSRTSTRILNNLQLDHFSVGLMGRTVIQLSASSVTTLEGDANPKDNKTDRLLPAHRLTVGDEVEIISKNAPKSSRAYQRGGLRKNAIGGVISSVTDSTVSIALFSKVDGPANNNTQSDEEESRILGGAPPFSVIPRSSIAVHHKMTDALHELERQGLDHPVAGSVLRAVFDPSSDEETAPTPLPKHDFVPFNSNLDDSQLEAIHFALNGQRPISLIRECCWEKPSIIVDQILRYY